MGFNYHIIVFRYPFVQIPRYLLLIEFKKVRCISCFTECLILFIATFDVLQFIWPLQANIFILKSNMPDVICMEWTVEQKNKKLQISNNKNRTCTQTLSIQLRKTADLSPVFVINYKYACSIGSELPERKYQNLQWTKLYFASSPLMWSVGNMDNHRFYYITEITVMSL